MTRPPGAAKLTALEGVPWPEQEPEPQGPD
jgi:hypothetical protein